MEIVEDRYGAGSTLITSQLPVEAWHEVIGEPTFADAILDRLVHNAYRLNLKGPSMRKNEAADAAAVGAGASDAATTAKICQGRPPMKSVPTIRQASRPPPRVNRALPCAPLRQTRGGHSAARMGPSR